MPELGNDPVTAHPLAVSDDRYAGSVVTAAPEVTARKRATRSRARFDARHAEIVDIAASLFARKGFDGTSVQDLCDATGLQRGALYHYIGSKKQLLFSIHERIIEPLLEEARVIEAVDQPPEATLRALAVALMRDIDQYKDQVTVFLHEWKSIKDDPEAENVREARRGFEQIIERVLARGVQNGNFRVRDFPLAKLAFLGMINYSYQWFVPGGSRTAEEVADEFSRIFLHGILDEA
jgi:AcrR family transcriptional regulator